MTTRPRYSEVLASPEQYTQAWNTLQKAKADVYMAIDHMESAAAEWAREQKEMAEQRALKQETNRKLAAFEGLLAACKVALPYIDLTTSAHAAHYWQVEAAIDAYEKECNNE